MARPVAAPQPNRFRSFPIQPEEEVNLLAAQVNGGMNTYVDPADISDAQVVQAKNMRISGDRIFPRDGTISISGPPSDIIDGGQPDILLVDIIDGGPVTPDPVDIIDASPGPPAIPNSNPVLDFVLFNRFVGSSIYVRFDYQQIFRKGFSSWTEITGSGYTIPYRPHTLALNDHFFFATGADPIQEFDFTTDTYADLGNAPAYKYIAGFFNRVVGANLYDAVSPNPIQIGRSGDLNFDEWDPSVDVSAGFDSLIEGQGDFNDDITGLFGFASVLLITRERSLWTVTKRASASAPFIYTDAYPNVGCDSPDAIAQTRNGITWYDYRSNQVYSYEIGDQPRPIGFQIRRDLKRIITDNLILHGAYDPVGNRFHLTIPTASSDTAIVYVYDFESGGWTYDERLKCYGVYPLDSASVALKINDLIGKINDLLGKINNLSTIATFPASIFYGNTDGTITQDSSTADDDNGVPFTAELASKVFQLNPDNISVSRFLVKFVPRRAGTFDVYYSRDGGATFSLYKAVTFTVGDVGFRKIATFPKHITTSEFAWKIISNAGSFDLNEYRLQGVATTQTRAK